MNTNEFSLITDNIRHYLTDLDSARESALPLCRETIRHCSNAIRAVHRQEFDQAEQILQQASTLLAQAKQLISGYNELNNTGFVRDAQKELAEASITLNVVTGKKPPEPDELSVEPAAYLNGLGEAVGELRRYLLDSIRRDDLSRCEEILSTMDDIYNILITIDFPDAITDGLRRTTDVVRGILERTRSDLTIIIRQNKLEEKLRSFEGDIKQG